MTLRFVLNFVFQSKLMANKPSCSHDIQTCFRIVCSNLFLITKAKCIYDSDMYYRNMR